MRPCVVCTEPIEPRLALVGSRRCDDCGRLPGTMKTSELVVALTQLVADIADAGHGSAHEMARHAELANELDRRVPVPAARPIRDVQHAPSNALLEGGPGLPDQAPADPSIRPAYIG